MNSVFSDLLNFFSNPSKNPNLSNISFVIFLFILTNYTVNYQIRNYRKKLVQKLTPEEKFILKQIYFQTEFSSKLNSKNKVIMNLEKKKIVFIKKGLNIYRYKINNQIKTELDKNIDILKSK